MRRPAFIAIQGRHPHGFLGAIIARVMANETAADNRQAIALLGLRESDHVLDVGTGHGRSLGVIAALAPGGLAVGVDGSTVALNIAKQSHARLIRTGRVRVEYAKSDTLPFADASFDRAMAVHTLYFWDPAEPHLREIARVLKPNGKLVLGFRPAEDTLVTRKFPASVYTFRTVAQVETLLAGAGFDVCRSKRRDTPGDSMVWIVARRA
jgi:ubiquinone/menaquinone biosynthesis C-methylase UbiE